MKKFFSALIVMLVFLAAGSCSQDELNSLPPNDDWFFEHKTDVPLVSWAIDNLQRINGESRFVPELVKEYGEAEWDFADAFYTSKGIATVIVPFADRKAKEVTALWVIRHINGKIENGIIERDKVGDLREQEDNVADLDAYRNMFALMDAAMFNKGVKTIDPERLVESWVGTETCTDWYQISTAGGEILSVNYLDTQCKTEYEWVPDPGDIPTGSGSSSPPPSGGSGSGSSGGSLTSYNSIQVNYILQPCSFNFAKVGSNWQAAGVKGINMLILYQRYPEVVTFNLEIGLPLYSSFLNRSITKSEAQKLSANAYYAATLKVNKDFMLGKIHPSTIPRLIAIQMQNELNKLLGSTFARVTTILGTNGPSTPVSKAVFVECN